MAENGTYRNGLDRSHPDGAWPNPGEPVAPWFAIAEALGPTEPDPASARRYRGEAGERLYTATEVRAIIARDRAKIAALRSDRRRHSAHVAWREYRDLIVSTGQVIWSRPWIGWVIFLAMGVLLFMMKG